MKYEAWRRSLTVESEFRSSLGYLVDTFNRIVSLSNGNVDDYLTRMNNFQNSFAFERFIYSAVRRMVTPIAMGNFETWRRAARAKTRSRVVYEALMDEINSGLLRDIEVQVVENANLIRTLPNDTAQKVVNDIARMALEGDRASTIARTISVKTRQHAGASARLIARTEVAKTTTALTKARAQNLGLDWYVWRTAQDGNRVRESHRIMEGVLVRWSDPPSPEQLAGEPSVGRYHPGEIWNCRCYPEPLIEVTDVRWPAKVYLNNTIQTMSRAQFERIA